MNITVRIIPALLLGWLISPPVFAAEAANDSTGRDDTQVYHVYQDVDMISTVKFQYDKPRIVIKSVYPQLQAQSINDNIDTFNQVVLDLVDEKITEYKTQVTENQDAQKSLPKSQLKNDLYIDYATSFIQSGKNPIISVRFSTQGYVAGMAHPYHHYFVLNYDLNANEKIDLADVFSPDADYLPVLSQYTSERLQTRLRDKQKIAEGTAPRADNFSNWNIKPNGILITFDESQVARDVDGAQTVLVPFSVLKPLIDPDSPIASCVAHKRLCSSNNILTGGFIDEARLNVRRVNSPHRFLNPTLSKL